MHRGALWAALVLLTAAAGTAAAASDAVVVRVPAGVAAEDVLPASEPIVSDAAADELAARARRRGVPAPDLGRWVRLDAGSPARAERIADALDARPGWTAAPALEPAPPPGICRILPTDIAAPLDPPAGATPSFTGLQDADDMLQIPAAAGADGAGIGVRDIEYDWNPAHEDLPAGLPARPTWTRLPKDERSDLSHGTAVIGTISGAPDAKGVSGLAPAAAVTPVSPYRFAAYDLAGAITDAAAASADGDVLLIEQQAYAPNTTEPVAGPVEMDPSVRAAIAAAVSAGVVVVEPAGNGDLGGGTIVADDLSGRDLATLGVTGDSGAIVVGAGTSTGAPSLRLNEKPLGNHGTRVDVQGLGEGVVTTGYVALQREGDGNRGYTHCFDGTSSASATVAGAIASLQGAVKARTGGVLSPGAVRALLKSTGAAQEAGVTIGPRPQIATALGTIPTAPPEAATVTGGPADGGFVRLPPSYTVVTPAGTGADWSLAGPRSLAGSTKAPNLGTIDDGAAGAGDGDYTLSAFAVDQFGRRSLTAATRRFTLDTTPPDAPVLLSPGPVTAERSVRFAWTPVGDARSGVASYQVRSGSSVLATLAPGICQPGRCETGPVTLPGTATSYSWTVRVIDAVGNTRDSAAQTLAVDAAAGPAPVITQSPAPIGSSRTPSFAWRASGADYGQFVWRIGGTAQGTTTTATSATAAPLPDGTYVLGVRQRKNGGAWGMEAQATFTVDATPPSPPVLNLSAADVSEDTTPAFGWAAGEAGARFRWQVLSDGQAVRAGEVSGAGVEVEPALGVGSYVFSVAQVDPAGNVSAAATRGFTIAGPPAAPAASAGPATPGAVAAPAPSVRARPALTGARATWKRGGKRLVLRLSGLATGARVTLAGKRITVRKGVAVVPWAAPGTAVLVVAVPRSGTVTPVRYRVVVTRTGAVKVTPLRATSPRSRARP